MKGAEMIRKNITGKFKNLIGLLILPVMIILLSIFATSCSYIGAVVGSGNVITEERDISGFDSISIGSSMNLIIEQAGSESLKIEAEDNIIPLVKTSISGKELVIELTHGSIISIKPINCYVTVKDLKGLKVSSSSNANCTELRTDKLDIDIASSANGDLNVFVNELTANVSSSANLKLSGEAAKQNVVVNSSGRYIAQNLKSKECIIKVNSSGSATVNVSDKLDAKVNSSGQLNYIGNPEIRQEISSSGSINNITK
jgi:hypothetical protein